MKAGRGLGGGESRWSGGLGKWFIGSCTGCVTPLGTGTATTEAIVAAARRNATICTMLNKEM